MKNRVKTVFFLTLFAVVLMAVGGWLGGQTGLIFAFAFSLLTNAFAYWFSDKIVLKMYKAQPVDTSHPLYETVRRLATRAGLPTPKVHLLNTPGHNAFATGRNPQHASVAITKSLLEILSQEELEGVMAHELGHIKNYDTLIMVVAATMASTLMFIVNMAKWGAIFGMAGRGERGPNLFHVIAMSIIGPMVALMIQAAISRSREFLADETGAKIAGSPHGLARALAKLERANQFVKAPQASPQTAHLFIVNPLIGSSFVKLFGTHPPIEERIQALLGQSQARNLYTEMRS
jgi:heat shock protein HtpX